MGTWCVARSFGVSGMMGVGVGVGVGPAVSFAAKVCGRPPTITPVYVSALDLQAPPRLAVDVLTELDVGTRFSPADAIHTHFCNELLMRKITNNRY